MSLSRMMALEDVSLADSLLCVGSSQLSSLR